MTAPSEARTEVPPAAAGWLGRGPDGEPGVELVHEQAFRLAAAAARRLQHLSETGVKLAQKMQVGSCIPVGIQLQMAEVGPTSGPHLASFSL